MLRINPSIKPGREIQIIKSLGRSSLRRFAILVLSRPNVELREGSLAKALHDHYGNKSFYLVCA